MGINYSAHVFPRFGHTLIEGLVQMIHETSQAVEKSYQLRDNFFNLTQYHEYEGAAVQRIINGFITQSGQAYDR